MYFTYILRCGDGRFYIGVTNNIVLREEEHNSSEDKRHFTSSRKPVELVYYEEYQYILDAIAREKQLKGWSRAKKKALISGDLSRLKELSVRHPSRLRTLG
jgi:putative endonuclease